jgi:hypothetical protein
LDRAPQVAGFSQGGRLRREGLIVPNSNTIVLYHCLKCGQLVRQGASSPPPQCCHQAMAKAGEDSIKKVPIPNADLHQPKTASAR